jgi:hypothetical protein
MRHDPTEASAVATRRGRRSTERNARLACSAMLLAVIATGCSRTGPMTLGHLAPGAELRATYRPPSDEVVLSRLLRQVNGSIEVATPSEAGPRRIPLVDLTHLETRQGRELSSSFLIGAGIGGLGGLVAGMACLAWCSESERGRRILAPVAGIAMGTSTGAVLGLVVAPHRWVEVRIR